MRTSQYTRIGLRAVLLAVFVGFLFVAAAGAQQIEWIRQFGSALNDLPSTSGVSAGPAGAFTGGYTNGAWPDQVPAGGLDCWIRRYDRQGRTEWTRQFGTIKNDTPHTIRWGPAGVYLSGSTGGTLPGQISYGFDDAFLRKYDLQGNEEFTIQFGTASGDAGSGVAWGEAAIYQSGNTNGAFPGFTNLGSTDGYLRKYDLKGNVEWTRQFGTNQYENCGLGGIAATPDAAYVYGVTTGVFPGETGHGPNQYDEFLAKYDSDGNPVWIRQHGTATHDIAWGFAGGSEGLYGVGEAYRLPPAPAGRHVYLHKFDFDGNLVWSREFWSEPLLPGSTDRGMGVTVGPNAVYVFGDVSGTLPGQTSAGSRDAFVRAYDFDGNELWTVQFGTSGNDAAYGGIAEAANDLYAIGNTTGAFPGYTNLGATDVYLVKLARKAAAKPAVQMPEASVALDQNAPNPFNPSTQIRYRVPESGEVSLVIYNLTGQRIRTLARGVQTAGDYRATWDGRDDIGRLVSSGVYLYRLEGKGLSETRRMILLK